MTESGTLESGANAVYANNDPQDKVVRVMRNILTVLANEYPEAYTEDGLTPQGIQILGILQQLLGAPVIPPGMGGQVH
jgi:hypothetical protein